MDGKLMIFVVFALVASFSSITDGGSDKIYIEDQVQLRPFDHQIQTKDLQNVVVDALNKDHKNRRMIDVSRFSFGFIKAWRGIRRFFLNGATRVFASSYYRDAKIGRTLKNQLRNTSNYDVTKRLDLVVPYKKKSVLNGDDYDKKPKHRRRNKNNDDSDEKRVPIPRKKRN